MLPDDSVLPALVVLDRDEYICIYVYIREEALQFPFVWDKVVGLNANMLYVAQAHLDAAPAHFCGLRFLPNSIKLRVHASPYKSI